SAAGAILLAIVCVACVLLIASIGWEMLTTCYELTDSELVIRQGRQRTRISLTEIDEVFPTTFAQESKSGLAAWFCWTWDGLRITIRGKLLRSYVVAPRFRENFLHDLQATSPGLQRRGEVLFRVDSATADIHDWH